MSGGEIDLDQFKDTYFEECNELLLDAETRLNTVYQNNDELGREDLDAIFRAVHSIKGGGGAFDFDQLVSFAHIYETLLDKLREGKIAITQEVISNLLAANDVLSHLIMAAQTGETLPDEICADITAELEALLEIATLEEDDRGEKNSFAGIEQSIPETPSAKESARPQPEEQNVTSVQDKADGARQEYIIDFTPKPYMLRYANEPLLLIRELKTLGELTVDINIEKLPILSQLEPDISYFSWRFRLISSCNAADIEEVFEFVEDDCLLKINSVSDDKQMRPDLEGTNFTVKSSGETDIVEGPDSKISTTINSDTKPVTPLEKADIQDPILPKVTSIRVDLDRVDRLVNMVGELVITQAMLRQKMENLPPAIVANMQQGFEILGAHTRELQESVMAVRMQPVKSVFARMPRLVRELASKLNKSVDLVMIGEATEVDKTVIEQLADPLTHMIRNSLDHGIEETENERVEQGKSPVATIHLMAEHRSGRIQIVVADDGRGIDRVLVRNKAVELGIINKNTTLNDIEIDELIFQPGFSTVDQVTSISGRGVGMDVVRRNILNLGGRISIQSTPGKGSIFTMLLPLTLAVLDGMIISVGSEKLIIPITSIVESIRPEFKNLHRLSNGAEVVSLRGEYVRLIKLYELLNIPNAQINASKGLVVIVELEGGQYAGVVVDGIIDQQQVVIKSLEENYDQVDGISAATILGDGKVALVLDVDRLDTMAQQSETFARLKPAANQTIDNKTPARTSEIKK